MNIIEAAYTNMGCPFPGGAVAFATVDDILAVGKINVYGDNVIRFMVKTIGNGVYFVKFSSLGKEDQKSLRPHFQKVQFEHFPTKEIGWVTVWHDIKPHPKTTEASS